MSLTEFPVWQRMLAYLHNRDNVSTHNVARHLKLTVSHAYTIRNALTMEGYVTTHQTGREVQIQLTSRGVYAARHCYSIIPHNGDIGNV